MYSGLKTMYLHTIPSQDAGGKYEERVRICRTAYRMQYGFSENKVTAAIKHVKGGTDQVEHARKDSRILTNKKVRATSFMRRFFDDVCDRMPTGDMSDRWHLPVCLSKKDVHASYVNWCKASGESDDGILSYSYFIDVWSKEFNHVITVCASAFQTCTT
jgi:hypothetical protein